MSVEKVLTHIQDNGLWILNQLDRTSTHQMLTSERPDRIQVSFDDHRLVANAGLILPVHLAGRLGLGELADSHLDLGGP